MRLQNRCAGIVAAMLSVAVLSSSAQAPPQSRPPQTFPAYLQGQYATLKRNITGSVDKMPAEQFSFKPAPEVMSYAEMLTHIVDTQYLLQHGEGRRQPRREPELQGGRQGRRQPAREGLVHVL